MNDLFSARLASLLFILVMFAAIVSTAEEQPDVLMDWDEIQRVAVDITGKVKVLPGDILKSKTYRIGVDEIPKLPHPHPICRAKEGWDSFPSGAKTPVRNYGTERVDVSFETPLWQTNLLLRKLRNWGSASMSDDDKKKYHYSYQIGGEFSKFAFSRKARGKGYRIFDGRYGLAFDRSYGGKYPYSDIGVNAVRNVEYVEYVDGVVKPIRKIPELEGFEPITRLLEIGEEGHVYFRTWVFLKRNINGSDLIAVSIDGSLKSHCLNFPEYGIDWGGIDPLNPTYPNIVLYDRNYGNWKGGKRMAADDRNPDYDRSELVHPQERHQDIHIVNIETGEMKTRIRDCFYCRLMSPSVVVAPHIALNGELGFGVYRDGQYALYLPYSCLLDEGELNCSYIFPRCIYTICNLFGVTIVDYSSMTVSRILYRESLDPSKYGVCSDGSSFLLLSKAFISNTEKVRDLYFLYLDKDGYRKIAFAVEIPEGTIEHAAPDRGFLAFDGKYVYLVNDALSFKISIPRNIIQ